MMPRHKTLNEEWHVGIESTGRFLELEAAEVPRFRAEMPGCGNVAHFNHAGASLMPQPALGAVVNHVRREAAIGGYEAADEAEVRLEGVYDTIARLVGAQRPEIAVIE